MSIFTSPQLLNSPRWKNARIGLLGGSFNPPHAGHVHISVGALKALELDAVWWLVSPQNPLKVDKPAPMSERIAMAEAIIDHPQILVSGLEEDLGTRRTYQSVKKLKHCYPHTNFVWISGMDNALSLHQWNDWQALLGEICMVHLTRYPARSIVQQCPLKMLGQQKHVYLRRAGKLPLDSGTTYWMMQKKMVDLSSTQIRQKASGKAV
jgi:nicotinate-nucleotide adenylyltransferase